MTLKFLPALTPKKLFLIDSVGATLTFILLSQVLVRHQAAIGMPYNLLNFLAYIAAFLAVYSFSCYIMLKKNWRPFLKIIVLANILYCAVTFGSVVYLYDALTRLGIAYFLGEILVILILVRVELKMAISGIYR